MLAGTVTPLEKVKGLNTQRFKEAIARGHQQREQKGDHSRRYLLISSICTRCVSRMKLSKRRIFAPLAFVHPSADTIRPASSRSGAAKSRFAATLYRTCRNVFRNHLSISTGQIDAQDLMFVDE